MKLIRVCMAVAFSAISFLTMAQTAGQSAISDEDLKKYAVTQDSVKVMQQTLMQIITENVQKNTVMPVTRYNELFKIAADETKLTAANATPEERAFLKEIDDLKKYNMTRINSTFQTLVKEYVGVKTFNTIKKALESDPNLKSRYETIAQGMSSAGDSASNKGN